MSKAKTKEQKAEEIKKCFMFKAFCSISLFITKKNIKYLTYKKDFIILALAASYL